MDCYDCELMKKCEECEEISYIGCSDLTPIDYREFYLQIRSNVEECYKSHKKYNVSCSDDCILKELCNGNES